MAALVLVAGCGRSPAAEAPSAPAYEFPFTCNRASLTADFAQRDALPHSTIPVSSWYRKDAAGRYLSGAWGPKAVGLPAVPVPDDAGCDDATWRRERVVATALRYLNHPGNPLALQYRHHHLPDWDPPTATSSATVDDPETSDSRLVQTWAAGPGLDCSNFTAWVYNLGLGIHFGGDVRKQWAGVAGPMGQRLSAQGPFQAGDLLYLHSQARPDQASHVVIVLDDAHIVDSRVEAQGLAGVQVRQRQGWYRTAVLGGWRPIG